MTENIIEMMMDHICISCSFSFLMSRKDNKIYLFCRLRQVRGANNAFWTAGGLFWNTDFLDLKKKKLFGAHM